MEIHIQHLANFSVSQACIHTVEFTKGPGEHLFKQRQIKFMHKLPGLTIYAN